jgi:hypothetical protein
MKFKFKISKLANQFFFISNLSEWHFSCRQFYNQEWLKQTEPLTDNEKQILKEFKKSSANMVLSEIIKLELLNLRKFLVWQLYPLVVYQIESKKKFDKDLINKTASLVLNVIKK